MIDITSAWALAIFALTIFGMRISAEFEDPLERRCMLTAVPAIFLAGELWAYGFDDDGLGAVASTIACMVSGLALIASSYGAKARRRMEPARDLELPREFITRIQVQREVDRIAAMSGCRLGAAWDKPGVVIVRFTVGLLGFLLCNHLRAAAAVRRVARRYGPACMELDVQTAVMVGMHRWILGDSSQHGLEAVAGDTIDKAQAAHMRGERTL